MLTYIVRVELRGNPSGDDYEKLHAAMNAASFVRQIAGKKGTYNLPHAEYVRQNAADLEATEIRDALKPIIASVYKDYLILVVKANDSDIAWQLVSV